MHFVDGTPLPEYVTEAVSLFELSQLYHMPPSQLDTLPVTDWHIAYIATKYREYLADSN